MRRLELEKVVKHYLGAEEVRAVDGVSLTITQGEMVSLVGPSGSGKTTLLLLMAALLQPEGGVVRYGERDLASLSDAEVSGYLMHEVGFIFQRSHLWSRSSAIRNASQKLIATGVGVGEARDRVIPWLERVGLGDRLERAAGQLSGGERQRVAIARVLACEPRLILADEPTGNLDTVNSNAVLEMLRRSTQEFKQTVLMITHNPEAAAIGDRILHMRDGHIVGD